MHSSHSNRRQRCGVRAATYREGSRTQVHTYEQLSINRISPPPPVSRARFDLIPESVAAAAGRTQQIVEDVKLTCFWHLIQRTKSG